METSPEAHPTCYRHPGRETLVSCSSCERPICTSCMVQAAVGVRCPECAGRPTGVARMRPRAVARGTSYVTITLVVLNVAVFVLQWIGDVGRIGRGLGGEVSTRGWLQAGPVADGEWWRIVTSAFLHAGVVHLAFNMIALYVLGSVFEAYVGPLRFTLVYAASVVWGAAGALLFAPNSATVGASGGVFGLMAAILVLQRQRGMTMFGDVGIWLGINLVITFTLPGISIGGHLGGIVGGVLAALALSGFGKGHMASRRMRRSSALAIGAVLAVGFVGAIVIAERAVDEPRVAAAESPVTTWRPVVGEPAP